MMTERGELGRTCRRRSGCRATMQIRAEDLPRYRKAAELAHGQAPIIATEGQEYASTSGLRRPEHKVKVGAGYVGVAIDVARPEMMNDFYRRLEALQKNKRSS